MAHRSALSIRNVLLGLGVLSVAIAAGLASFALFGSQRQSAALRHVVTLEEALQNHSTAEASMDSIRTDVLRALQASIGVNKEGGAAIQANFRHHVETIGAALARSRELSLAPDIHASYDAIAGLLAGLVERAQEEVGLALSAPAAAAANYERFHGSFSRMESTMDAVREILRAEVKQVRTSSVQIGRVARQVIVASALVGVVLLVLVTTAAVRIVGGITTDLASSREEAQRLSLHDALTGLPNRALLFERLGHALTRMQRDDSRIAVLCLDLDRFKQVNDTLGHPVGDALLCAVSERLRAALRECDTVARLGGDEFAVIQSPVERVENMGTLARRLIDVLSEPYDIQGHQVLVGASVGIALAPEDSTDADELLKMADMALYRAKADGRGMFRLFEAGMDAKLQARRALELDLRKAIALGEFDLHYQPLVDLASGRVIALEALVRWRHPERGLISPCEFVPLAEETGLIVPLGAWVLQRACADAAGWPADVRVAVNLSAVQFKGAGLTAAVLDALSASALDPKRLELEITETVLLTDADATLATLHELRDLGVSVAMDDFGTGYSSLGYLRSFPFDKIKIDQSFVRDIETSTDCKAIVRAVAGLGVNLGIVTTAEGVETIAQLRQLQAEGCDQVQGYFFSRPVPVADVANLLTTSWGSAAEARREVEPALHGG